MRTEIDIFFIIFCSDMTLRREYMRIWGPQFPIETHVKLRSPCARSDSINFNPRDVPLEYDFHFSPDNIKGPNFALMNLSFSYKLP